MAKKKFVIETPVKNFKGVRKGLTFKQGKAVTEDEKLAQALVKKFGYYCDTLGNPTPKEDDKPEETEPTEPEETEPEKKSKRKK